MSDTVEIRFTRTGGRHPELARTFRTVELDADDVRAWLGIEPPTIRRGAHHMPEVATYRLEFRRGGERRVVTLTDDDLDARLEPLVGRLVRLCDER